MPTMRPLRIALYSHDTMGIGHVRRNLLIARTLASSPLDAAILIIAGAREAGALSMPPGVDCLTLPALRKQPDGQYRSRHLAISLQEIVAIRAHALAAALEAFAPDALIVDKVPRGAVRELEPSLRLLRDQDGTAIVLGLRDILDEPAVARAEWRRLRNEEAIREYYDAVWVYGDPAVYDTVREYHFAPDVAARTQYVGYLDQQVRLDPPGETRSDVPADLTLPPGPFALCLVGGGEDGAPLAEAFARAELPPGYCGVILTGPLMPPPLVRQLRAVAAIRPQVQIVECVDEPARLTSRAERVVAMGGYNTICEVLSFEKPALIVPRVRPRREQLIRAERLRDLGVLDVLHPDDLDPRAVSNWLAKDQHPSPVRDRIDLDGLTRLPGLISEVLGMTHARMSG